MGESWLCEAGSARPHGGVLQAVLLDEQIIDLDQLSTKSVHIKIPDLSQHGRTRFHLGTLIEALYDYETGRSFVLEQSIALKNSPIHFLLHNLSNRLFSIKTSYINATGPPIKTINKAT
ncbi:hypothetical protein [Mameliella sp.]|uniref:hypothetical protein n=1 Tax=Mameliella sp. TaxID=1924940 RepID=UPI003B500B5D